MINTHSCPIRIAIRLHFTVFWKSGHIVCQKPVTMDPCNSLEFTIAPWAKIWCACLDLRVWRWSSRKHVLSVEAEWFPLAVKYFSIKLYFRDFSSYISFLIPWNKSPQSNVLIAFLWWISSLHSCSLSCPWISFLNPLCPLLTSCWPSPSTAALSKQKGHTE